jgi:hypothetical protein
MYHPCNMMSAHTKVVGHVFMSLEYPYLISRIVISLQSRVRARCYGLSWALDPSARPARHSRRWILQLVADDADCATVRRR